MADERLEIEIVLDDGSIVKGFKRVETQSKKTSKKVGKNFDGALSGKLSAGLGRLKTQLLGVGAAFLAAFAARRIISAAIAQEEAINSLNIALQASGKFTQQASKDFQQFASEMQNATRFGDEVILENAALLQSLGNLSVQGLQEATRAALDLSAALKIDLRSATLLVGKAAAGEISSFSRYGVIIKKGATQSETFANTLAAINKQFGGAAAKQIKTFGGATDQLANSFGDVAEALGEFFTLNTNTIKGVNESSNAFKRLEISLRDFRINTLGIGTAAEIAQKSLNKNTLAIDDNRERLAARREEIGKLQAEDSIFSRSRLKNLQFGLFLLEDQTDELIAARKLLQAKIPVDQISDRTIIDPVKLKTAQEAFAKHLLTLRQQRLAAQQTGLKDIQDNALREETQQALITQRTELINDQFRARQVELDKKFGDRQLISQGEFNRLTEELEAQRMAKINAITAEGQARSLAMTKQIQATLVSGISSSVASVGAALAKGQNAFEAFGKGVLGILGDLLINIGTSFIATSQAIAALSIALKTLFPAGGIAAGLALIALGGSLKALGGGGGGIGAASTGGGIATGGAAPAGDSAALDGPEIQQTPTLVTINVEAPVDFDRRKTGLELSEILQDVFESNNTVVALA